MESDDFDVDGFRTLASLANLELNLLTIEQGASAGAFDVREVDEQVVLAVAADESEALLIIEELHGATGHVGYSLTCYMRPTKRPDVVADTNGARTIRLLEEEAPRLRLSAMLVPCSLPPNQTQP